jgi:hypothetical protein
MRAHHFPPAWKHATTVMILKPGKDPTNPLSYRPISLLNIAGAVFEKILSNRLKNFLEINNLLPPEQFGFRSEHSTINPILEFHTDTTRRANLKEHTLAVFLDIERAFDRVWHDGLVQKLIKIPINPNFIQLIDSFLSNRTCSVKIQNIKSRPIALQAGVPQGSILSPLLYIVYCRDFPVTDAPRTKTRLFADDTAVWTSQRNPAIAARILQGHLDKHLENQTKPAQIPVHLNVLLRSQVPPPSPPSPSQQPGHPQTSTRPLPRRHLFQKLHPQPGRQRNPQKIPQLSQPPVQDSRVDP